MTVCKASIITKKYEPNLQVLHLLLRKLTRELNSVIRPVKLTKAILRSTTKHGVSALSQP